jgi:hypothetical protein
LLREKSSREKSTKEKVATEKSTVTSTTPEAASGTPVAVAITDSVPAKQPVEKEGSR